MEIRKFEKDQFSRKGHIFGFNMLNLRCRWHIGVEMSGEQLSIRVFTAEDKTQMHELSTAAIMYHGYALRGCLRK